jgi:hypothetical protein
MRLFFLGFLIFASSSVFSQKIYSFDYVLQYDFEGKEGAPIQKEYFYTNSKDNSYKLHVLEKDSLNFKLDFMDFKGMHAVVYLSKADFFIAESITVPCKFVSRYQTNKFQTKNYDFLPLQDTVIHQVPYYHYVLKSNSVKREKKKKLAKAHYIIDKNSSFHLPLFIEDTAFEEWKVERNIPNGIPVLEFLESSVDKKIDMTRKLIRKESVTKRLLISKDCDYVQMDVESKK